MTQLPTWPQITGHTREALNQARSALSEARDWMKTPTGPTVTAPWTPTARLRHTG
jgi:hypothetical protein